MPDFSASAPALDELQPVAARPGVLSLRRDDLHDITTDQRILQRDELAVHPAADAPVAHLGVHGVREVDRGSPGWQGDHIAGRGVNVNFGRVDLEP